MENNLIKPVLFDENHSGSLIRFMRQEENVIWNVKNNTRICIGTSRKILIWSFIGYSFSENNTDHPPVSAKYLSLYPGYTIRVSSRPIVHIILVWQPEDFYVFPQNQWAPCLYSYVDMTPDKNVDFDVTFIKMENGYKRRI